MNSFPAVDPIPLPAPIWLFKVLHVVTLTLHFISVEMLLGGLLVAVWLNFRGAGRPGDAAALVRLNASAALARRLPIVMTYVINLGVPPLLFAQVLYGRALYTSSVLIGTYWIAVVFLLMLCYWLLYRFAAGTEQGRGVWWQGLIAWLTAGAIAKIYTMNMTLMLRPEVWQKMYSNSAAGLSLATGDPTMMPRWLFMITGGFVIAGLWMIWIAGKKTLEEPVRKYLAGVGGWLALVMIAVQALVALRVFGKQPEVVRGELMSNLIYQAAGYSWLVAAGAIAIFGLWSAVRKSIVSSAGWASLVLVFVAMLSMTVFRDGIRDVTLLSKGFKFAERVVPNWGVLVLFLVLFVAGLAVMGWLISVVARAKPVSEKVTT